MWGLDWFFMLDCNYQEMCELCGPVDASHLWEVWIDLCEQILEVQSSSLAPKDEFEVEGPDTWQLVTGKDPSWVSSNAQAT